MSVVLCFFETVYHSEVSPLSSEGLLCEWLWKRDVCVFMNVCVFVDLETRIYSVLCFFPPRDVLIQCFFESVPYPCL